MNQERRCPNCRSIVRADAPAGICPACALRAGFAVGEGSAAPTRADPVGPSAPMTVDELARRLPELEQFEPIGRGGMGAVYRARHRILDRLVAVKVLDAALRDDAAFAERFVLEARTLAQLDHPNIVRVYDFGHRDGLYFLIMELVDGVSLRQMLDAGRVEPREALVMVPRICEALQYAHDQGVVHRDIKPENILVDRRGTIKIADFGLAKLVGGKGGGRLTRTRQVMGTPQYMAPEQLEHPRDVDHRADIFALGVVFYELLTGELPVGRFALPSTKVQVDVRLDDVVLRTLEKEPSLRYQRAGDLGTAVEEISGDASNSPRPSPSKAEKGYEFRSKTTLFGLPLVHIAFSGDWTGRRMRVASGVIAIGDMAIGIVSIGDICLGGIAVGGIGVGVVSLSFFALGLLTALGGVAFGGHAIGGLAIGLIANGAKPIGWFDVDARIYLVGQCIAAAGLALTLAAATYAWIAATRARYSETD